MNNTTPTNKHNVNISSKSQLAKLLATENIKVRHSNTSITASFDVDSRLLTLPVWDASEHVYNMLVAHEVGHALITPPSDVFLPFCARLNPSDPLAVFPYLNIIEDIRVDNHMRRKYPGVRRSYFFAYKELTSDLDFFGIKDVDIATLSFMDRVNIFSKSSEYTYIDVPFSPEESALLEEALAVESFDDVCAVVEKIVKLSSMPKNQQPNNSGVAESNKSNDNQSESDSSDSESSESPSKDKSGEGDIESSNDEPNASSDDSEGDEEGDTKSAGGGSLEKLKTTEKAEETIKRMASNPNSNNECAYYDMPTVDLNKYILSHKEFIELMNTQEGALCSPIIHDYAKSVFAEIEKKNKDFVSNLVKQFEQKMAAEVCRRTQVSRTGRLDMRKICEYRFNDTIFVKNQYTPDGKNHGMVFFVDWSGSMNGHMMPTIEQLLVLCMFCRKMNIPFDVYAFTTTHRNSKEGPICKEYTTTNSDGYVYTQAGDYMMIQGGLIHLLSSETNNNQFRNACEMVTYLGLGVSDMNARDQYLDNLMGNDKMDKRMRYFSVPRQFWLGSTPLNDALYASIGIINNFRAKHRVDVVNSIFLTDGGNTTTQFHKYAYGSSVVHTKNGGAMSFNHSFIKTQLGLGNDVSIDNRTTETIGMAELVKEHTGCNMIFMYICAPRDAVACAAELTGLYNHNKKNTKGYADLEASMKENHFLAVKNKYGFHESFFIDSKIVVPNDDEIYEKISQSSQVGTITRAFIRGNTKRGVSRVLLSRFADIISKKAF